MIPLLLAAIVELRLDYARVSLTKTVRHYTQIVDGIEVAGGERIEENGRVTFERLGRLGERRTPSSAHLLVHRQGAPLPAVARLRRRAPPGRLLDSDRRPRRERHGQLLLHRGQPAGARHALLRRWRNG